MIRSWVLGSRKSTFDGLTFSEMDLSLVNSLAEQSAAIKNSDAMNLRLEKSRMDSDLGLAKEVQELSSPKSPDQRFG